MIPILTVTIRDATQQAATWGIRIEPDTTLEQVEAFITTLHPKFETLVAAACRTDGVLIDAGESDGAGIERVALLKFKDTEDNEETIVLRGVEEDWFDGDEVSYGEGAFGESIINWILGHGMSEAGFEWASFVGGVRGAEDLAINRIHASILRIQGQTAGASWHKGDGFEVDMKP